MRTFIFLLFLTTFCWQCDNTSSASSTETATETAADVTSSTPPAANTEVSFSTPYPSITQEKMMYLLQNCDYIDFIFYGTNFSMSQKEPGAIRGTLAQISTTPARVIDTCQPIGRIFFQVDGQNAEEADIFFGGNCLYYIFLENGSYAYGNQMTEQGQSFYTSVFQNVQTQSSGQ